MLKKIYEKTEVIFKFLVVFIIVWPLLNSFFGLDLVDSGFYMYHYDSPLATNLTYSTYLATMIGSVWHTIFPSLGIWGMYLLEVLLEYAVCFSVYLTFHKRFGKLPTLAGITLCMVYISTYVNIFNYHQLNMLLCVWMLCLLYKGLELDNLKFTLLAGGCGMLAVATRVPSVLTVLSVLCIIYWALIYKVNIRRFFAQAASFFSGYVIVTIIFGITLKAIGMLDWVIQDIFRIGNLGASGSGGSYGVVGMIKSLIVDTFHASKALGIYCVGIFCLIGIAAFYRQAKNQEFTTREKIKHIGVHLLVFLVMYYAAFVAGKAPSYAQLNSFIWLTYGICLWVGICLILRGMVTKREEYKSYGLIALMAENLMFITFVGSNVRLKHSILGLWIFMPLLISLIIKTLKRYDDYYLACSFSKGTNDELSSNIGTGKVHIWWQDFHRAIRIGAVIFLLFLAKFWCTTNNFDSVNRFTLNTEIDSPKAQMVYTTERGAEEINGVLDVIDKYTEEDSSMMVFGNGIMLYYLSGVRAYVKPWVTGATYTPYKFGYDLGGAEETGHDLPIIVESRTNLYLGFDESVYETALEEGKSDYSGKREMLEDFMTRNNYVGIYRSDYFKVYVSWDQYLEYKNK